MSPHDQPDDPILQGKVCPYCNKHTEYVDSSLIYGKSYGMIYLCQPCDAWCGVHKGTDNALGRIANKQLRELKKLAHYYFDPLWKRKMNQGLKKGHARSKAYKWLSREMGIEPKETHIGMFNEEQCNRVIEICKKYYKL